MNLTPERRERIWLRVRAAQLRREQKRREDRELFTTVGLVLITIGVLVLGMIRRLR